MTVLVTRNVEGRVRGFLASTMLEIASGVYTAPNMSAAVRERVWAVLEKWRVGTRDDSTIMTWPSSSAAGGQEVKVLGEAPIDLTETPSIVLARRSLTEDEVRSLTTQVDPLPF
jgi:CRISPR-associated protein Cas2